MDSKTNDNPSGENSNHQPYILPIKETEEAPAKEKESIRQASGENQLKNVDNIKQKLVDEICTKIEELKGEDSNIYGKIGSS